MDPNTLKTKKQAFDIYMLKDGEDSDLSTQGDSDFDETDEIYEDDFMLRDLYKNHDSE
jgi:hypothetical protein